MKQLFIIPLLSLSAAATCMAAKPEAGKPFVTRCMCLSVL